MYINSPNRIIMVVLCVFVASTLTACFQAEPTPVFEYQLPEDIGDGWEIASLQDADLDEAKVTAMVEAIHKAGYDNFHSILIARDGRLVFETYFQGHTLASIGNVASVTKSVTSILVGVAIDKGFIVGPDQYLHELLPSHAEILNADPSKRQLQLWHILTMTSGIQWDEASFPYGHPQNDATRMERSSDPVKFILERPIVREPGTQFQYSGANTMLLSAILQDATGMTVEAFAKSYLFEPLGISHYRWSSYPDGHTNTDGGLALRPRDMAKIGQLMLNNGRWDDLELLSPEWVADSTRAHTNVMPGVQYGYQWWQEDQPIYLETVHSYFAAGYGGQLISIYPDQDTIVIFTGETADHNENSSRIMSLRARYLLPALFQATLSKTLLWGWYILTIATLFLLLSDIARGQIKGLSLSGYWLLIGAILGPLGLIGYVLSYRYSKTARASGFQALGISTFFATGYISGLILLAILQYLLLPEGRVILLAIPAAFLVSWLTFITPLSTLAKDRSYWKGLRQTLSSALISSIFVSAGIFPVLVLLSFRWPEIDLNEPMFWIMMTACSIAGAVVVYPYSLWIARRRPDFWPTKRPMP